ncbi:MAG: hypothetical protein ACF8GE_02745 [Phycisphaerales bacterium JB043]
MAVSKQTFSTVRGILEQLDNRISEARERRTGSPEDRNADSTSHRQFGTLGASNANEHERARRQS